MNKNIRIAKQLIKIAKQIIVGYRQKETGHWKWDRVNRNELICNVVIPVIGKIYDKVYCAGFEIDDENRPAIKKILEGGITQICNPIKNTVVTVKFTRPPQLYSAYRLPKYEGIKQGVMPSEIPTTLTLEEAENFFKLGAPSGGEPTKEMIRMCEYYEKKGWNEYGSLPASISQGGSLADKYEKQRKEFKAFLKSNQSASQWFNKRTGEHNNWVTEQEKIEQERLELERKQEKKKRIQKNQVVENNAWWHGGLDSAWKELENNRKNNKRIARQLIKIAKLLIS